MIKLEPCDILLVSMKDKKDIWSKIGMWGMESEWGHVMMVLPNFSGIPMVYQSRGRGAVINSLISEAGQIVLVLRPQITVFQKMRVIDEAIKIASDPKSYYDYYCIIRNCVPRVLWEKYPCLPIPSDYIRDAAMICSEGVAEPFWRALIEILPQLIILFPDGRILHLVPLPPDFVKSPILQIIGRGRLMVDVLP